jgi:cell division protein FtsB
MMEINTNTVLTAFVGALTGAGGLGGILTLFGKNREADAAAQRQYYDKITARQDLLESRVDALTRDNVRLGADVARLMSENEKLHAENKELQRKMADISDVT